MTILNVDDSMTMRKIVSMALKGQGHTVVEAENGKHALELLAVQPVNAIILDVNMPVMNGIEFLKELAKDPRRKDLPVIVLTTQGEDALKEEALSLGAKAFMVKPFKKEELAETLRQVTS